MAAVPEPADVPWFSKEDIQSQCRQENENEMKRVAHYRHGRFVNANMLDFSAQAIGLKELWIAKWHRKWPKTCDHLPDWEVEAPWMVDLPDPCPPVP
jgi:hypothetical protein